MSQAEYDAWNVKYQEASMTIVGREEKIDQVALELEKNFILIGSTAIEDKLQDGVGDTIQFMKDAGIKVWVLTGDKVETAVTIGLSSGLLDEHGMNHYYLTNPKEESLLHTMVSAQKEIKNIH